MDTMDTKSDTVKAKNDKSYIFSDRIRKLSQKTGLHKKALAHYIGISRAMFYAYLKGESPITPKVLEKLRLAELKSDTYKKTDTIANKINSIIESNHSKAEKYAMMFEVIFPEMSTIKILSVVEMLMIEIENGDYSKISTAKNLIEALKDKLILETDNKKEE